jgi:hypothetical protein
VTGADAGAARGHAAVAFALDPARGRELAQAWR